MNADRAQRLTDLVSSAGPTLLAYFERRVEIREDAADLLAETYLTLWRRIDTLPRDAVEARMWAFGVARHVLAGSRRGASRRSALATALRAELSVSGIRSESDQNHLDLRSALDGLSSTDREIVTLVAWDGFTLAEVARILHRPAGTIRSRYHRARATLATAVSSGSSRFLAKPLASVRRAE